MVLLLVGPNELADVRRAKSKQDLGFALGESIRGEILDCFFDFFDGCLLSF